MIRTTLPAPGGYCKGGWFLFLVLSPSPPPEPDYIIYQISGLSDQPLWRDSGQINKPYSYALYDLANDERTKALDQYRAVEMAGGRYVEFLQLKAAKP